jgi:hypothetical protein
MLLKRCALGAELMLLYGCALCAEPANDRLSILRRPRPAQDAADPRFPEQKHGFKAS